MNEKKSKKKIQYICITKSTLTTLLISHQGVLPNEKIKKKFFFLKYRSLMYIVFFPPFGLALPTRAKCISSGQPVRRDSATEVSSHSLRFILNATE